MKESSPISSSGGPSQLPENLLDSWKEIAAYVKRDISTVQRWEKREGMPIHRHVHDKRGSVYAYPSELDAWIASRKLCLTEDEEQQSSELPFAQQLDRSTTPRSRAWLALGLAAILVLAGVVYVLVERRSQTAHSRIGSIAVLPLENLSGDPTQEYLADGMTEALIGRLSGIHNLRVISRTSVMGFKNTHLSVPVIARQLNVDAILEGSVMREGNRIRVHAQLIRAATDEHFWSETYDRELQDVFALQSDIAQSVAQKVKVTLTGEEHERLAAIHPASPEVYEDYLKGRFALGNYNTKSDIENSLRYFNHAIATDETFAPAYLGLADAYSQLSTIYVGEPPYELRSKSKSAVEKALELDPNSADAHLSLAEIERSEWRWSDSELEFQRALSLSPNSAAAHVGMADWLLSQGRTEEALTWARHARDLDPLLVDGGFVGWILFCAHRYDEALAEFRSVVALHPNDAGELWSFGFVLIAKGQPDQAIPPLEKALSISGRSPGIEGVLIRAYAHAGRRHDALRLLAELKERKQSGYVPAGAFVNAYLGLGDYEQAFIWLDQAYKEHSNILLFVKTHPYLDPLRSDPRFQDLVRRMGLS